MDILKFTVTVRESIRKRKYRYGEVKVEASDLESLIGKKVQIVVLPDNVDVNALFLGTFRGKTKDEKCVDREELCKDLEEHADKVEFLPELFEQELIQGAKSYRERKGRMQRIEEVRESYKRLLEKYCREKRT